MLETLDVAGRDGSYLEVKLFESLNAHEVSVNVKVC